MAAAADLARVLLDAYAEVNDEGDGKEEMPPALYGALARAAAKKLSGPLSRTGEMDAVARVRYALNRESAVPVPVMDACSRWYAAWVASAHTYRSTLPSRDGE